MNSLNRRFIAIVGCSGFWTMILLCLWLGYSTVTGNTSPAEAAAKSMREGGKIVLTQLSNGTAATYSPSSGKLQYQLASTAKTKSNHSHIKQVPQPASNQYKAQAAENSPSAQPAVSSQTSAESMPAASASTSNPVINKSDEHPEIQKISVSEEPLPSPPTAQPAESRSVLTRTASASATPAFPEMSDRSQFQQDDTASPVRRKIEKIPAESPNPIVETASQMYPMQEIMEIIARSLLKFSLIVACCLSLYFSYSALQIAKSTQRARRINASGNPN